MTVDWQPLSLPLGQGVDQKTDERVLPVGKLARLENAVFDKRGSLRKRNGYAQLGRVDTSGTDIDEARALMTRGSELLLSDGSNLYSYSPSSDSWSQRGDLESVLVSLETVAKTGTTQTDVTSASAGGITVIAWYDSRGTVRCSVYDTETGAVLASDQSLGSNTTLPKAVAVGGFVHIVHRNTSANELRTLRVSPADVSGSLAASPLTLANDINTGADFCYDVYGAGSRAVYAYRTSAAGPNETFTVGRFGASGSVQTTTTSATGYNVTALAVCEAPDGRTGVAGCYSTRALLHIFDTDLADDGALIPNLGVTPTRCAIGATAEADANGAYQFHAFHEVTASPTRNSYVYGQYIDTDGANQAAPAVRIRHSCLASSAWGVGRSVYANILHESDLQATYFTMRQDGRLVSRFLAGTAGASGADSHLAGGVESIGGGEYRVALPYKVRLDADTSDDNAVYAEQGAKLVAIAHEDAQAFRSVQVGESTYVSGGFLWQYDGVNTVESGFHVYPENVTAAASNGTGSMASSVAYSYRVYYEWTNARGERERSTTAEPISITLGGTDDTVTLTIPTLCHTGKSNVSIAVYRTEDTPGADALYYRVSSLDPTASGNNGYVANSTSADTVTFVDGATDASIIDNELDEANAGGLDPVAPPPPSVLAAGKGRMFLAGLEDGNEVRYSRTRTAGELVSFNEALAIYTPEDGGPVTGLAVLNEALVIFKAGRIYAATGDGLDNLGASGSFSEPQIVTSDVGCSNQRSIIVTPQGVMFQSAKGIHLLSQQFQIIDVGEDVDDYGTQTITAATVVPGTDQVRLLTDDGLTLLFDHGNGQWSTFTNHEGVAAVVWDGSYLYARANGRVMRESATAYTDAGTSYRLLVELPWLQFAGVQGWQKIKELAVLGEYRSAHQLRASFAYDYRAAFVDSLTWNAASVVATSEYGEGVYGEGVYGGGGESVEQARFRMPRQKAQAIKVRIEDIPGSPPGESLVLSGLRAIIGIKRGSAKLAAARSL